jgi:putative mRNA 3-end processing factor
MDDFDASKGFQYLFMSEPTKQLLVAERNADLPFRENLQVLETGRPFDFEGHTIELLSSSHMLGAVQVAVALPDGRRVGYSGDFQWPVHQPIQVEGLVVDSTYGNPDCRREYTRADVEARLLELVHRLLRSGAINIVANRGTLHRAMQILAGQIDCPIIGSRRLCSEVQVYRDFGLPMDTLIELETADGRKALREAKYIRVYGKGDGSPDEPSANSTIVLSAFMSRPDDPVLAYSNRAFRIALSDHADFEGTLQYIRATGAQYVVTDNTRGGNAITLATEIRAQLGIDARPSTNEPTLEWGK